MANFISNISSSWPMPGFISGGMLARESLIHNLSLDVQEGDNNWQRGGKTLINTAIRASSIAFSPYNVFSLPYLQVVTNPFIAIGKGYQAWNLYTEGKRERDLAMIDEAKKRTVEVAVHVALSVFDYWTLGLVSSSNIFDVVGSAYTIGGAVMDWMGVSTKIHDELFEDPDFDDEDGSVEDSSSEYWSRDSSSGSESESDSSSVRRGVSGRGRGGSSLSSARGGRGRGRGSLAPRIASSVPLFLSPAHPSEREAESDSNSFGGGFVGGDDSDSDREIDFGGYPSSGASHDSSELSSEDEERDLAPPPRSSRSSTSGARGGSVVRRRRGRGRGYSGSSPTHIGQRESVLAQETLRDPRLSPSSSRRALRPNPVPHAPWTPTHNPWE